MSRQPDAHESYAVAAGVLHWAAAILALSLLAIVLGVYVWARPLLRAGAAPVRPLPPQPRLQPDPAPDLAAERSLQQSRLDGYMWLDDAHTVARIPITRAMALLASPRDTPAAGPRHGASPTPAGHAATEHKP
jgi:hypothetical protein